MTHPARRLWRLIEAINGVTYFAPTCRTAMDDLGLKGFWMGYFAARSAPFGPVGPAVVEATFYNFAPSLVRRAIPDAWDLATPEAILEARAAAAAEVLRRARPGIDAEAARIVELLVDAKRAGRVDGRPLFAANQAVPLPPDPVAALWQCCTALREHRGDGHVAMLVGYDLSGVEAHQVMVAAGAIDDERLRTARGWQPEEWTAAKGRLRRRGLLDADDHLTDAGATMRDRIESSTDQLAMQPYQDGLTDTDVERLPDMLEPIARAVYAADILVFPNPMGLDRDS
jgi:Helix-turn-helix family